MKLLLDTHTFIWWDSDPGELSATALALCTDPANELILSVTSLWEMQIKHQLGKLSLRLPLSVIITHQQATNGVIILPILPTHVFALDSLPMVHKDPFDRLLVAQAYSEGATLVSAELFSNPIPFVSPGNAIPQCTAQPGVTVNRFARETILSESVLCSVLAATERQVVVPPHQRPAGISNRSPAYRHRL